METVSLNQAKHSQDEKADGGVGVRSWQEVVGMFAWHYLVRRQLRHGHGGLGDEYKPGDSCLDFFLTKWESALCNRG